MKDDKKSVDQSYQENLSSLQQIQMALEELFPLIKIDYKVKLTSIKKIDVTNIENEHGKIIQLINKISHDTKEISKKKTFLTYREFPDILHNALSSLELLNSYVFSNMSQFYQESYRLLKYYWAIRYVIARFELERIPQFMANQIQFFNLPDELFNLVEKLKDGPQPMECLAEIPIKTRTNKGLPLLIKRDSDKICLSILGERFLNAHSISEFYFYYLYDFEEDVLDKIQ